MPYQGIYDRLPAIAVQNPFCQYLLNFNISEAGLSLRNGDSVEFSYLPGAVPIRKTKRLINYSDTDMFLVVSDETNNNNLVVDDASATLLTFGARYYTDFTYLIFNKNLFIFPYKGTTGASVPLADIPRYDGAAWVAATFTSATALSLYGGNSYKNRIYLLSTEPTLSTQYFYGEINAISGALTAVDLGSVISQKADLVAICNFSIAESTSSEVYIAFIFSSGEVLFYSGSYPDSSDWRLVAKSSISKPISYNLFLEYQGDTLIPTISGIISLRDLFLKGSQDALSLSITKNISKLWEKSVVAFQSILNDPNSRISGMVWDAIKSRIIFTFPYYTDPLTNEFNFTLRAPCFFVYNTELGAWSFHRSYNSSLLTSNLSDIIVFQGDVHYLGVSTGNAHQASVLKKEGDTGFQDEDPNGTGSFYSYSYYIQSSPVTTNNGYINKVQGMDVILESDLSATTEYTWIKEMGVDESNPQKVNFGSGIQKPFINSGIEGTFIQYKISGTTAANKTVGLDLYGVNIWQDSGGSPR